MKFNRKRLNLTNYLIKIEVNFMMWARRNRHKLFAFVVLTLILTVISRVPYLNLFFSKQLLAFFVVVLAIFIFNLSDKKIIILALIIVLLAAPPLLLKRFEVAESLGNFAYGIFIFGVLKFIVGKRH